MGSKKKHNRPMTARQLKFAVEYVKTGSPSKAYKAAGYSLSGNSNTISRIANTLLHKPNVKARIEQLQRAKSSKLELSAERVLLEFTRIGFSDPRRILNDDGKLLPPSEWPDDMAQAIKSVKIRTVPDGSEVTEVQLWPKTAALDSLAKNLGLFLEHNLQKKPDCSKSDDDLLNELKTLQDTLSRE